MSGEDRICFVIAPIGESASQVRRRSDQVLKHIISPAVEQCGYRAIRADQISEPGMITSQVIQHIVDDPLVVADLTGRNPNVFYELAIRHALRKPLVQLIARGEQMPFDVAGTRTIHVDHHDLDSVEEAKEEIIHQVEALESQSSEIETPISVSLDLKLLRQSEDPEERSLGELLGVLTEVRTHISTLEKRIDTPEVLLPPTYLKPIFPEALFKELGSRETAAFAEILDLVTRIRTDLSDLGEAVAPLSTPAEREDLATVYNRIVELMEITDRLGHRIRSMMIPF